jgi:hypothetical protein
MGASPIATPKGAKQWRCDARTKEASTRVRHVMTHVAQRVDLTLAILSELLCTQPDH